MERIRLSEKAKQRPKPTLPPPCVAVTGRDNNRAWFPYLTKPIKEHGVVKSIGLDPKMIPHNVLIAAGHPSRSATACIKLYLRDMDMPYFTERDFGIKRVRELCMACAEDTQDVRRCTIINCPLWGHRMGYNPHNWHRRHSKPQE